MSSEYRKGTVYIQGIPAGIITETDEGYSFKYDENYLLRDSVPAASLTLPLREEEYRSNVLFPFFDGLIPEGWLLAVTQKHGSWIERIVSVHCLLFVTIVSEMSVLKEWSKRLE